MQHLVETVKVLKYLLVGLKFALKELLEQLIKLQKIMYTLALVTCYYIFGEHKKSISILLDLIFHNHYYNFLQFVIYTYSRLQNWNDVVYWYNLFVDKVNLSGSDTYHDSMPDVSTVVGHAYYMLGDLDRAYSHLNSQGSQEALFYVAGISAQRGDINEAICLYSSIILSSISSDINPWTVQALLARGVLHANRGDNYNALRDFDTVIRYCRNTKSSSIVFRIVFFILIVFTRVFSKACEVVVDPYCPLMLKRHRLYMDILFSIVFLGILPIVAFLFNALLNLGTSQPINSYRWIIQALINRGWLLKSIDKDAALSDLSVAVKMSRKVPLLYADALIKRGMILTESGRFDEAIYDYSKVLQMSDAPPSFKALAHLYRGTILLNRREQLRAKRNNTSRATRIREVLHDFSEAIRLSGSFPEIKVAALLARGRYYLQHGEIDCAACDFGSAFSTAQDPYTKNLAIQCLLQLGNCDR